MSATILGEFPCPGEDPAHAQVKLYFTDPLVTTAYVPTLKSPQANPGTLSPEDVTSDGTFPVDLKTAGNLEATVIGKGLQVKTGVNGKLVIGATLVAGTLIVANTAITANSHLFIQRVSGDVAHFGALRYTKTPSVGYTIFSTDSADISVFDVLIVEGL